MKNVKNIILGMVFLFGMSSVNASATVVKMDECAIAEISSLEAFQDMNELLDMESAANYLNDYIANRC